MRRKFGARCWIDQPDPAAPAAGDPDVAAAGDPAAVAAGDPAAVAAGDHAAAAAAAPVMPPLPADLLTDFEALWELRPHEYGRVRIAGRVIHTPRWTQTYLRAYDFTGMNHEPLPLPPILAPALAWANTLYPGEWEFNQVLVNWYENGRHYIGPHSDDTRQLVPQSPILSISLGAERLFRVRGKYGALKGVILADIPMPDRSYLVMGGEMQDSLTHEVPKISGAKGERWGRRINLTFRAFRTEA